MLHHELSGTQGGTVMVVDDAIPTFFPPNNAEMKCDFRSKRFFKLILVVEDIG